MAQRPWLRILPSEAPSHPSPDTWTVPLDATQVRSTSALFDRLAEALEFPGYFGRNWDALDECLIDLLDVADGGIGSAFGDRPGRRCDAVHLQVHGDVEQVLRDDGVDAVRTLVTVLRRAAHGEGVPPGPVLVPLTVEVAFGSTPPTDLPDALRCAGIRDDDLLDR